MKRYISVDDLKDVLNKWCVDDFRTAIDNTPDANVREVRYGHWDLEEDQILYNCSACGALAHGVSSGTLGTFNFCPYCGADMRGWKR